MKRSMPGTDSIEDLAQFWQAHDLTDFADGLVEEETSTFCRRAPGRVGAEPGTARQDRIRAHRRRGDRCK